MAIRRKAAHKQPTCVRSPSRDHPDFGYRLAVASGLMSWLPDDFVHPVRVPVPGTSLHLRPIREADTALDYPAVMGSRERLWEIFGPAWAWPKDTMTFEQDRRDLRR